MIGFLSGKIIFSDGREAIILTSSGIGHQVMHHQILPEGGHFALFISEIIRENARDLFAHNTLREKKLFELLLSVKGVGPKSAYAILANYHPDKIIEAILLENKKLLNAIPGIGAKASAQIILDLSTKVSRIKMYSDKPLGLGNLPSSVSSLATSEEIPPLESNQDLFHETLMACKELGFKEDQVYPIAARLLAEEKIFKSEQLLHLVLKNL